ncbi:MAG: response regulator transcription factor, partial [Comamonadaceae bacterium]
MIHVVLCDDHAVLRRGIRDTLTEAPDISVTGEAGSYSELRDVLRTAQCDVLLLDLNLPGRSGLEVLASLKETHAAMKVLIVSMYPEDQYALRCLRAGAQGYANKAGDPIELIAAVRTVVQGRKYLTAEVAQMLADSLAQPTNEMPHEALSERELQTLVKIASGRRLSDIAEELMLSP